MVDQTNKCIKKYIEIRYEGGLIGINDLVDFCHEPMWRIYASLTELQSQEQVEIVKRYFCPESHPIPNNSLPYCPRCHLKYSMADIITAIYVNPIINLPSNRVG